jgi:predicted ester cyclase
MTGDENVQVVRCLYDSFNAKDLDRFDAVARVGATVELRPFDRTAGLREAWQMWATAFPDGRVVLIKIEAGPEGVRAEFNGRGTHTGPLITPLGTVGATYRRVELRFVETYELDETEGKIVRGTTDFDAASLFAQLGVEPPQPPRPTEEPAEVNWGY